MQQTAACTSGCHAGCCVLLQWTVGLLIPWMKDNLLTERAELFVKGTSVRPGILVLINDTDWELK